MAEFRVAREHFGDRMYSPGEVREAPVADVQHLVRSGVLIPLEKAIAPAPLNKSEQAPRNKGWRK